MSWKDNFPKENRYFETDNGILYCDNCNEIMKKFPKNSIDLVVTSPPYYVGKEYEEKNKTVAGYNNYLNSLLFFFKKVYSLIKEGGNLYINIDDTHTSLKSVFKKSIVLPTHAHLIVELSKFFDYKEMILWKKIRNKHASGGAKRLLGSYGRFNSPGSIPIVQEVEYILWFKKTGKRLDITDQLRKKSSLSYEEFKIWGMQIWNVSPNHNYTIKHPAVFPEEIPYRLIKLGSFINDLVFDPFMGSGTTAVVCEKINRRWIGVEINKEYCSISKERILSVVNKIF